MKAITACPYCAMQFYVDDEQLTQFNGKVRCGSCMKVFTATDYIVQTEDDSGNIVTTSPSDEAPQVAEKPQVFDQATQDQEKLEAQEIVQADNIIDISSATDVDQTEPVAPEIIQAKPTTPDHTLDELEELSGSKEVDENFIAKTESLIKNIDIDDVASKLETAPAKKEPTSLFKEELKTKKKEDTGRTYSFMDDGKDDVIKEDNSFSFKIESPDSLDVLSKWREEANKPLDEIPAEDPKLDDLIGAKTETASINEAPKPMTDDFVMPEPKAEETSESGSQANQTGTNQEGYDFLINEKEPVSPIKILLVALLVLLLLGQVIYYFRNTIAREVPAVKPLLVQFCGVLNCEISLPQEINLLSIDDSGIQQDPKLPGVIRLTSTITNRANFKQAYPNLEVTLTDELDKAQVRRIFNPDEYLQKKVNLAKGIESGESIPVEMSLMTDNVSVSGFRILLTY